MQRHVRRAFWICILGGVVCLSTRLMWLSSNTETGLPTLQSQWWDATLGLILGSDERIASCEPVAQAEFWLGETHRVLKDNPNDAQVAMGAALVLDGPGTDFMGRYLQSIDKFGGISFPEIDREGIKQAEDAFEYRCKDRCLQLATTATQLDGDNVEWWRLRALLLFHESMNGHGESPRDADWLEIIDECARHDPENALYDYLVANHFWDKSADVDFSGEGERLIVEDVERFEEGISRFERGRAKPVFAVGDAGFTATAIFLDHSRLPPTSHISIINSRTIHYQRQSLLRSLCRWQDYRAKEAADIGNIRDALDLHRQNLNLIAQYTDTGPTQAYDIVPIVSKVATANSMRELSDAHPREFSAGHSEDIIALQNEAMLRQKVVERAAQALAKGKPQRRGGLTISMDLASVVAAVFVGIAPTLVILLLALGLAATVALRWSVGDNSPGVGPAGHLLAMTSAFVTTVVLLGLAPAKIINGDVQAWSLSILLIVTPQVVLTIETAFQEDIAFARRPASHWENVENAVSAVVADEQQMKSVRQNIEAEVSGTATQDVEPDDELR